MNNKLGRREDTPERQKFVGELDNAIRDLAALMREQGRQNVGGDIEVFLHQSINFYADTDSLRRIVADVRDYISQGAP